MGLDYRTVLKFETNLKMHVEMHVNILKYIIEILRILLISKEISNKWRDLVQVNILQRSHKYLNIQLPIIISNISIQLFIILMGLDVQWDNN